MDMENCTKIIQLLKSSLLPEQSVDCVGNNLHIENYKEHVTKVEINISRVLSSFVKPSLTIETISSVPKEIILYSVILIGEHAQSEDWTSSQTIYCAKQLLKVILECSSFSSLLDILIAYKVDYFLIELKPKLLSSTWKKYPASISCFIWIITHIKGSQLGDNINIILPTCLLLIDDHTNSNKIKGLKCLQHVSKYVTKTDLIQYGRAEVIYNAVEHMVYSRDSEIIPELSKFLVEFLSKTEHLFTTNVLSWSHFDDILNIWLPAMEMEQNISLREAYIESLNSLLQAMGLASVRWSVKLLRIISEYSEQELTLNRSLSCLLTFIQSTWPRISSNAYTVFFILMKVTIKIYNNTVTSKPSGITEKLVKDCFDSLKKLSNKECNELYKQLRENKEIYNCCSFII